MAAGNMDKDKFCEDYKKHQGSKIIDELYYQTIIAKGLAEELDNRLKKVKERDIELAGFLLSKACAYDDTDFYKQAVKLVGQRGATALKIRLELPLWDEDKACINSALAKN